MLCKGGDLNKCQFIGIDQYIGIDIADLSVKEAFERYTKQRRGSDTLIRILIGILLRRVLPQGIVSPNLCLIS